MKRSIEWSKAAQPLKLGLLVALAVSLSSCASATQPCAQGEPNIRTVGSHNSFLFRKDWRDFRSDLAMFREAATKQDAQGLRGATSELKRSIAAIKRYSPMSVGEACATFTVAKVKLNAATPQLDQLAAKADWSSASKLAAELTDSSDQLREALPSSWFTRHRHGKRFH